MQSEMVEYQHVLTPLECLEVVQTVLAAPQDYGFHPLIVRPPFILPPMEVAAFVRADGTMATECYVYDECSTPNNTQMVATLSNFRLLPRRQAELSRWQAGLPGRYQQDPDQLTQGVTQYLHINQLPLAVLSFSAQASRLVAPLMFDLDTLKEFFLAGWRSQVNVLHQVDNNLILRQHSV